jgi:hypothetical protein
MDARIRVTIGALLVAAAAGAGSRALYNRPPKQQLDVPFTSQAPAGNWLEPWQNACEETSVIMVTNFFKGDGPMTAWCPSLWVCHTSADNSPARGTSFRG